ncbi:MAG: DUF5020 family protein [Mariniphaga sp.]|nr:DUF5020 family protein [Mariniphaga sp.]
MRKRIIIIIAIIASVFISNAQNIQLHYDMGKDRGYLTSTVEMFKPDNYGSTFFFVDMDYGVGDAKGVSLAYWEIARAIKFWDAPVAFHVEYNGGFGRWQSGEFSGAYEIEDAWLAGLEYSLDAEDYSKGFTIQALYKYIRGKHDMSFQLTGVWYVNMLNEKISFTGYADFWRENFFYGEEKTKYVLQAEPQLWYNFSKNIALGGEVEVDYNFLNKGWKFFPTIGTKVTF